MQSHQIHVLDGRERVHEIRTELFAFPEVLDVFVTGRPDALVVVYLGRPRPGDWLRTLRAVGYRIPARQRASAAAPKLDSVHESDCSRDPPPRRRRHIERASALVDSSDRYRQPAIEADLSSHGGLLADHLLAV